MTPFVAMTTVADQPPARRAHPCKKSGVVVDVASVTVDRVDIDAIPVARTTIFLPLLVVLNKSLYFVI